MGTVASVPVGNTVVTNGVARPISYGFVIAERECASLKEKRIIHLDEISSE
jgi:hypothetical protein